MDVPSNFSLLLWSQSLGLLSPEGPHSNGASRPTLVPSFDSSRRTATLFVSVMHLTGSLLGGGLFLVPTLFSRCDKLDVTVVVLVMGYFVNSSLSLTVLIARSSGLYSYHDLVSTLLGDTGHFTLSVILLGFLSLVLISYFSMMICIWIPVTEMFLPNRILALPVSFGCTLALFSPFLCRRDFRFNPGFVIPAAASVLSFILMSSHTTKSSSGPSNQQLDRRWMIFFAAPIVTMNLFSNQVLKVHSRLVQPTMARVSLVIRTSTALASTFIIGFGWTASVRFGGSDFWLEITSAAYLEGYQAGKQPLHLLVLLLGFVACVGTILISSATILPQYRRTFLFFVSHFCISPDDPDQCRRVKELCPEECCDEDDEDFDDQQTCVSFRSLSTWSTKSHVDVYQVANEETHLLPRIEEGLEPCNIYTNTFAHFTSTAAIIILSFAIAMLAYLHGVAVWAIWSVAGCFFAPCLSFAVPAICFLQIQKRNSIDHSLRRMAIHCWLLLLLSAAITILSTTQVAHGLLSGQMTDLLIQEPFT